MAQIDLVLARRIFVEAVLDGNAHRLERSNRFLAQSAGDVGRGQVEEAAFVERHRCLPLLGWCEVEELDVGRDVEGVTVIACGAKVASQHLPRVAFERCAVEVLDVAKHSRLNRLAVAPWQHLKSVRVGHRQHVGFLHTAEAVDGRAIECHAVAERVLEFGGADREALQIPQHVGEPQTNQPDAALLNGA